MAQLRIIGEPDEVQAIIAAIRGTVDVTDLSPGRSRRNAEHVLMYGHVGLRAAPAPAITVTVEHVQEPTAAHPLAGGRRALPPGS